MQLLFLLPLLSYHSLIINNFLWLRLVRECARLGHFHIVQTFVIIATLIGSKIHTNMISLQVAAAAHRNSPISAQKWSHSGCKLTPLFPSPSLSLSLSSGKQLLVLLLLFAVHSHNSLRIKRFFFRQKTRFGPREYYIERGNSKKNNNMRLWALRDN